MGKQVTKGVSVASANGEIQPARTVAVIDLGSNSLRMVIAEVYPDGRTEVLERTGRAAHLGHDVFVAGKLSQETMNAAVTIMRDYRRIIDTYEVGVVRAVATSAVREASNRDAFLDRIARAVDLDVEVIESAEQCSLIVSAVRTDVGDAVDLKHSVALVAEVGGGDALVAILRGGDIAASQGYNLGSIRMQEMLSTSQETPARAAELIRQHVENSIHLMAKGLHLRSVKTFLAVGGDARFAAEQVGEPLPDNSLTAVDAEQMDRLVQDCMPRTPDELSRTYGIPFADAETLVPALLVYQALLHATRANQMIVSQVSMRDGLLLDLPRYLTGEENPVLAQSIVNSARSIAERYQCDLNHAEQVTNLALRFFDELQAEHALPPRCRLLLRVAALLHDVGTFVNARAHHKHSYYLIANSEIFGLQRNDLAVVAQVARYHRRAMPKSTHPEYIALPREQRMVVNKLAAMLRLADALDRGHCRQVSDFSVEYQGQDLTIYVRGAADLTLERRALADKADLFEEVFGMHVRLEEERS